MTKAKAKAKTCTCCGGDAGHFEQWFNQDAGFGLCGGCVKFIRDRIPFGREELRISAKEFEQTYGKPGVHYDATA